MAKFTCWKCKDSPATKNQILCETCFESAANAMLSRGLVEVHIRLTVENARLHEQVRVLGSELSELAYQLHLKENHRGVFAECPVAYCRRYRRSANEADDSGQDDFRGEKEEHND